MAMRKFHPIIARFSLGLGAALLLSGCVSAIAESRVENALLGAGVSERTAGCMAGRMVDRLTIDQLRQLEELRQPSGTARESSLADYLDRVNRVGDAEVISVTASSAALCASGLAQ
jgi:hypothetical protein